MMKIIVLFTFFIFAGCASNKIAELPRTKWTDKNLRVMIDPDKIDSDDYFKLQTALVQSDNFTVVDRAAAFKAVEKEQERLHRDQVDRFEDKEKWAHWGKLYGIGAVVVPHQECTRVQSGGWSHPGPRNKCYQYLSIVDANTGEVISMIENLAFGDELQNIYSVKGHNPPWNEAVAKLMDAYPKKFGNERYHPVLQTYQSVSKEEAIRQKEETAKQQRNSSSVNNNEQ